MNRIEVFEKYAQEYDEWFEANKFAYRSEIRALKKFVPRFGRGMEVGVGSGRFATSLGIEVGIEPAKAMADLAKERGIEVCRAIAETLPFINSSFDFVLIVATICFVQDPPRVLKEVKRVLRPGGRVIVGMIDRESFLGKFYESKKKRSKFYRYANFYSVGEVIDWLEKLDFGNIRTCQTIFKNPNGITAIEPLREGYGKGGFVVISASKI